MVNNLIPGSISLSLVPEIFLTSSLVYKLRAVTIVATNGSLELKCVYRLAMTTVLTCLGSSNSIEDDLRRGSIQECIIGSQLSSFGINFAFGIP